jgi:hypothetical protein
MGKTWTGDNLLRQVVYEGLREDKPAAEVRREVPHANPERRAALSPRKNERLAAALPRAIGGHDGPK